MSFFGQTVIPPTERYGGHSQMRTTFSDIEDATQIKIKFNAYIWVWQWKMRLKQLFARQFVQDDQLGAWNKSNDSRL